MVEPLVVDVVVTASHKRSKGIKAPLAHQTVRYAKESIHIVAHLQALKKVLESNARIHIVGHLRVGRIRFAVEVAESGLTVVLFSDIVYSAHTPIYTNLVPN